MEGAANALSIAMATLLVGALVYSHLSEPAPTVKRAMRGLGFAVHVAGLLVMVVLLGLGIGALLRTANPLALLWPLLGALTTWWLTGGIAMRFGVRRDELIWWRRTA
jgi:hypothetical protein